VAQLCSPPWQLRSRPIRDYDSALDSHHGWTKPYCNQTEFERLNQRRCQLVSSEARSLTRVLLSMEGDRQAFQILRQDADDSSTCAVNVSDKEERDRHSNRQHQE
jgi:hypothetical protein